MHIGVGVLGLASSSMQDHTVGLVKGPERRTEVLAGTTCTSLGDNFESYQAET